MKLLNLIINAGYSIEKKVAYNYVSDGYLMVEVSGQEIRVGHH